MARKKKLVVAATATEFAPELGIALAVIVALILLAIYGKNWLSKLTAPFVTLWQELTFVIGGTRDGTFTIGGAFGYLGNWFGSAARALIYGTVGNGGASVSAGGVSAGDKSSPISLFDSFGLPKVPVPTITSTVPDVLQ